MGRFLKSETFVTWAVLAMLLVLYGLFIARPINLTTADIGRHIENGTLLFEGTLVRTNFYSYTNPDFPVVNHHWGSGALLYLAWKVGGFIGAHLLFIALALLSFFFFWSIARKEGGFAAAALVSVLVIPLLSERAEVRPEVLSALFCGIFFWLLSGFRTGEVSYKKLLIALPLLEILWVNSHIYFFLGPVLIGAFALEAALLRQWEKVRRLCVVFGIAAVATFVNPFGIAGALAPFTIFKNYGYMLVENQSVWFLETRVRNPNLALFKVIFWLLVVSFALALWKNRRRVPRAHMFLAAGFSLMAWLELRNFALFGLFALPLIATNLKIIFEKKRESDPEGAGASHISPWSWAAAGIVFLVFLLAVTGGLSIVLPTFGAPEIGLAKGVEGAADFWKREKLTGPIFNNYDIGGYLIYTLYPRERVFVDNRPEAYPAEFFTKTYIPMQESSAVWHEQDARYHFNAIFFSYHDLTPWGQQFLGARLQDPDWAPVFVDPYNIIFLRRASANNNIIDRYKIPVTLR